MVKNAAVPLKNAKCQLMLQSSQFSNIQAESKLICHSLEIKTHWIKARDRQKVYITKISVKSRSPIVMVSQLTVGRPPSTRKVRRVVAPMAFTFTFHAQILLALMLTV